MRYAWALASLALGIAGAAASDAPAPGPSPTLAPITLPAATVPPASASASPAPGASPGRALKVIERLYVNRFCSRFVQHFDVAADVLIANDAALSRTSSDLDAVERDYVKRNGAVLVYDDRNRLIKEVGSMVRSIPAGQAAVNDLLAQARETKDPTRHAELTTAASNLQRSIDRQRAVAYDVTNVIHVLLDKHTIQDTAEYQIAETQPYTWMPVNVTALDDPVPQPGSTDAAQALATKPATTKEVLQFDRQRWIIAHAESNAAVAAEGVAKTCVIEEHSSPG